ncbi:hypothetical protein SSX86_005337 [Deinandra increscens subsp. villosa]|uniref:Calmodulin-binding protein n=1 Tax=Deinandra increscens subsp. villosa TaxID=3103831 RepID=A0AAP0DQB0_9ASTR
MEQEPGTPATNGTDLTAFADDFDSACSTPFVSAPSSPGRGHTPSYGGGGFFYSAPASPIHFMLSSSSSYLDSSNSGSSTPVEGCGGGFEFEFTAKEAAKGGAVSAGSMSSADELFLNGQIRPMKLSSHLQRPQMLAPLLDVDENEIGDGSDDESKVGRGRDLKFSDRSKSLRRRARARSLSPLRTNNAFQWLEEFEDGRESTEIKEKLEEKDKVKAEEEVTDGETPPSCASSRSSSVGRSSKRWVFLKEFLYRSKSEGRSSTTTTSNGNHKFWTSLSFSPSSSNKEKKSSDSKAKSPTTGDGTGGAAATEGVKPGVRKAVNGVGMTSKRRAARSAHELHYTTNRAQAEELRRKTYLPYKQGLLGCLGFSSRSYGAMNGFARALNPVSSR